MIKPSKFLLLSGTSIISGIVGYVETTFVFRISIPPTNPPSSFAFRSFPPATMPWWGKYNALSNILLSEAGPGGRGCNGRNYIVGNYLRSAMECFLNAK